MRSSALWGTGGRGGEGRSKALSGRARVVLTAVAALALAAPLAATAAPGGGHQGDRGPGPSNPTGTYVAPDLQAKAKNHPYDLVRVIIQSSYGTSDAASKARGLGPLMRFGRNLNLVGGVAVQLPARLIQRLSTIPGLSITPDVPVKVDAMNLGAAAYSANQLWPHANGDARLWNPNLKPPTIAVVDSGIDPSLPDFSNGARVVANVNLSSLDPNATTDDNGHGTMVAGVAAGSAPGYAGAAPNANIVAIKVMNQDGEALTSDVIAACNWLIQNKDTYNIRVANFSLHSSYPSNFGHDALDQAVEKLWFDGITVVAAAGNYGNADGTPSGVHYAPGNDPFVITVGALDLGKSASRLDDSVAPWSAYGYTYDGFWKPDVSAAGRYVVGPVPTGTTLDTERPDHVVAHDYMQLSGTSFSAPVVAGTAAELLARHPNWTPDQVKGALMYGAQPIPAEQAAYQGGVGEINAVWSNWIANPPNPNAGLDRFVTADPAGGSIPVFDSVSWYNTASTDVSWNSVSWTDVSWTDVSWNSVSWTDVSWTSVSWTDVSWTDVSWTDLSSSDAAKEDAVAGDGTNVENQPLDAAAATDIAADPALNVDPSLSDPAVTDLTAPAAATPTTP